MSASLFLMSAWPAQFNAFICIPLRGIDSRANAYCLRGAASGSGETMDPRKPTVRSVNRTAWVEISN
jgi:hypothetical protein